MTQQIKLRRDTASNYTIKDNSTGLVIGDGEVALETDKLGTGGLRLKIGDGWMTAPALADTTRDEVLAGVARCGVIHDDKVGWTASMAPSSRCAPSWA